MKNEYDLSTCDAIIWGQIHLEMIIKDCQEKQRCLVEETGLWLNECGVLEASPDGFLGKEGVIEIKNSWKHHIVTAKEAVKDKI